MILCNRNYKDDALLSVEDINGIACCPNCKKPAICHGKSVYYRALYWALSDDTGVSSKTLARHMMEYPQRSFSMPPSDADDRGRCIRLLELVPEWIPRLPELVRETKPQEGIVINSSGVHTQTNGWATQIPLIIKEGNLNATDNTTAT